MNILATDAAATGGTIGGMLIPLILIFVLMYFLMIRPQQKETKRKDQMLAALEIGDTVLTTSGFYGTIIDINEDTLIVEFGNNRNCRIPMQRAAVSAVEKPEDAVESK